MDGEQVQAARLRGGCGGGLYSILVPTCRTLTYATHFPATLDCVGCVVSELRTLTLKMDVTQKRAVASGLFFFFVWWWWGGEGVVTTATAQCVCIAHQAQNTMQS